MKIVCLLGSPRKYGNSATIARRFTDVAAGLGADIRIIELNQLKYRGCQGCMACKTSSDECVLEDDLTEVLDTLKSADIVVMAMPVYCSDVPGQVKCFLDRTFSYFKPDYRMEGNPSRVPPGKKLVFIITQGAPVEELFLEIPQKYQAFLKRSMGIVETFLIRGVGVGSGGVVGVPEQYLREAESIALQLVTD